MLLATKRCARGAERARRCARPVTSCTRLPWATSPRWSIRQISRRSWTGNRRIVKVKTSACSSRSRRAGSPSRHPEPSASRPTADEPSSPWTDGNGRRNAFSAAWSPRCSAAQVSHVGQRARVTRCVGGRGQSAVGFRPAQVEAAFFAVERTTGASDPDSGPRLQRAGDGIRDQVEYPQRHRSDADGTARRSDHALADGGAAADPRCDGAGRTMRSAILRRSSTWLREAAAFQSGSNLHALIRASSRSSSAS